MFTSSVVNYKNYGKCLAMNNGLVELYVTVDVGPRIIKVNLLGRENLACNDVERRSQRDVSDDFGAGRTWYIYGGHRQWVSPEHAYRSYYPDNDPVPYTLLPNGAVFTPAVQDVTGYGYEWTITFADGKPEVSIQHKLTNCGDSAFTGAIWCLSVLDKEGFCIIPQETKDTGLLANRGLTIWPYTDMSDSRVFWGEKYIGVKQDSSIDRKFKIGITNTVGALAYINRGQALVKRFPTAHFDAQYPDWGMSSEVFTDPMILEVESLSPLYTLPAGASVTHTETWTLYDGIEAPCFCNECIEKTAAKIGL